MDIGASGRDHQLRPEGHPLIGFSARCADPVTFFGVGEEDLAAAPPGGKVNGSLDGGSIVGDAVASGTEVKNIDSSKI